MTSTHEPDAALPVSLGDAVAAGQKFYFTGKPCKRGHVAKRNLEGHCHECRKIINKKHVLKKRGVHGVLPNKGSELIVLSGKAIDKAQQRVKVSPWEWRKEYFFSSKMANRIIRFFERRVVHIEGELQGQPFILEPWQRKILRRAFGWHKRADGLRKFRIIYIEVPRKNGKSAWASGIALYLAFQDKEPGAKVVSAAAETEQAGQVFNVAKEMVQRNLKLAKKIRPFKNTLVDYSTASNYKVISAEAYSKHGKNLHGIICDEVHAQPNRELIDVLRTSTGARRQPMQVYLTTAGYDKNSVCYEMHSYAQDIMDGTLIDPSFLPVIYAASEDDDWRDEKTWYKANPNLGISKKLDYMRTECEMAKKVPAYENTFKRLDLNIWTEQDSRWIAMARWNECNKHVDATALLGRECVLGLDLSSTTDITAAILLFKMDDGSYQTLCHFWLPGESALEREKRDKVPYPLWIRQEYIEKTHGDSIDYTFIEKRIEELGALYDIREVAYDRWNATQLVTNLEGKGMTTVPVAQGFSMSGACKELMNLILAKKLNHSGNPVLRWMAKNVAVIHNGEGDLRLSKKKSKERIDGLVALAMALDRQTRTGDQKSVYEERGLITV